MKQRVNRLVMLRARGLSGPFFQNVGGGRHVHTAGAYLSGVGSMPAPDKVCPLTLNGLGEWEIGGDYGVCSVISHLGRYFVGKTGHTASVVNEPGVGDNWEDSWTEVKLYSPSQTAYIQPSSIAVSAVEGATTPTLTSLKLQSVDSNGAAVSWTLTEQTGSAWLSVDKASGQGPMDLAQVTINPTALADGTYTDALVFTASGQTPIVVPITLTVEPAGVFVALESGDGFVLTEDDAFVSTEDSL
jgi:hypothetical protein